MTEDKELEMIKRRMMERLMGDGKRRPWIDGKVMELMATNFDEILAQASKPVLVDFWAGWCAPCRMMKPVVEALARDYAGKVSFAKVDVDRNQSLARRHSVLSIPNFVLFKKGRPVDRVVGVVGRPGLEAMLLRHLT